MSLRTVVFFLQIVIRWLTLRPFGSILRTKVVHRTIDTLFMRHYIFDMAKYDYFIFNDTSQ